MGHGTMTPIATTISEMQSLKKQHIPLLMEVLLPIIFSVLNLFC